MDQQLEQRVLLRAVRKGILSDRWLRDTPTSRPDPNVSRIDFLRQKGILSEHTIDKLVAEEVIETTRPAEHPHHFGHYRNLEFLGQGGMAQVYKGYDEILNRTVALKFIRGDSSELTQRFVLEARAQARIEHPRVCKVYEAGEIEGKKYIAMQYIDGKPLTELKDELTIEEKVRLIHEVGDGLHAAHKAGLIHRDIKPANIMVERQDDASWSPYILDFGLVREVEAPGMTQSGVVVGSPWYMPPEQVRGEVRNLDRRSDVYSLGVTFYELLTGHLPFEADSSLDVLMKILQEDPQPPRSIDRSIPVDLETIILKAIEKNAENRYESAKAMAEDIQRYLDGEPVLARAPHLGYRLFKKAKKYKAVVIIALSALLSILLFAGIAIKSRWDANRRAAAAQQFGGQIKEIEAIMRYASMLPLHDLRKEKSIVRGRLSEISADMKSMDDLSKGPAEYALGRGYLALNNYASARSHLQKAWETGYRDSAVAYALGLTLGVLYQKEIEETEHIRSSEQRELRKKQVEKEFREPALHYLNLGKNLGTESPEYVEALLAFYQKKYSYALKKADEASDKIPWLYEAHVLKGNVYSALSIAAADKGSYEEALRNYQSAQSSFAAALKCAPSDGQVHEKICEMYTRWMESELYSKGGDIQPYFEKAVPSCKDAILVDPEQGTPYIKLSRAYMRWGEYQGLHGQNPSDSFSNAIRMAERSIHLDDRNFNAYQNAGIAYRMRANYAIGRGLDPTDSLNAAIRNYQKSLSIHPQYAPTYNSLGNAYINRGFFEASKGINPEKSFHSAIENFTKSAQINPDSATPYNNMSAGYNYLAEYQMAHGRDAEPAIQGSIAAGEKAIRLKPDDAMAFGNLGNPYSYRGEYELSAGKNPENSLNFAIQYYQKALSMNPTLNSAFANIGLARNNLARYFLSVGKDPTGELKAAIRSFQKAMQISNTTFITVSLAESYSVLAQYELNRKQNPHRNVQLGSDLARQALKDDPQYLNAFQVLAELQLIQAQWETLSHKNPEDTLKVAEDLLIRAEKINTDSARTAFNFAELYRRYAEMQQKEASTLKQIELALGWIEKTLERNPRYGEAFATRGLLYRLRASYESGSEKDRALILSKEAFEKAYQINPNLKRNPNFF